MVKPQLKVTVSVLVIGVWCEFRISLYPDLLTPAFVACSTNVGKAW